MCKAWRMLKALSVFGLFTLVLACSSGQEDSAIAPHKELEFFNPFYVFPEEFRDQSCVIDALIGKMPEDAFIASLDRIIEHTNAGIYYSDMSRRDRVIYVAPVACDRLSGETEYSAGAYFKTVRSETHKPAADYPFLMDAPEADWDNLFADLDNAAFAVDLTFPEPESEEESLALFEKVLCVSDDGARLQKEYGLPILQTSIHNDALIYIYNMNPADTDIVVWLVKHGLRACGLNFPYTVRDLNGQERAHSAAVFKERK